MKKILMHVLLVIMLCSLILILPATSAENGKIVFSKGEIFIMNSDGSEQTQVTNPLIDAYNWQPECSPDGNKIAFASKYRLTHSAMHTEEIYIINTDGTGETRLTYTLTPSEFGAQYPTWFPIGPKITFWWQNEVNPFTYEDTFIMNPDGTKQKPLNLGIPLLSWSPDGEKFVFANYTDGEIYVMNADGTGETRLTNNAYLDNFPVWSPDGTKIAFISDRLDNPSQEIDIYIMNAVDGSDQTRLTFTNKDNQPAWSPDGKKIVFTSARDGIGNIYVMNADGSEQTRLTTNGAASPSWCPVPAPGSLEVISSPSKAKIYINGIYTEQVTRWKFDDMAPGDYKVYVMLDGYATPATETVKVISGQTASLHFKLDKLKKVK